jgi:uncharacterized protein (TIGR04255 family)
MTLPVEISPNPLVTSTIEVRYASNGASSSDIIKNCFATFLGELPLIDFNPIPLIEKQANPQLKYVADITLNNESYKISFSNTVIAFENIGEYKLWGNYFPFVQRCLNQFFNFGHINKIERIGVRYASVLDKTESAAAVLNIQTDAGLSGYDQKFELFRTNLRVGEINMLLQIFEQARATKGTSSVSGVYIDIDASITKEIEVEPPVVFALIENLHKEQKALFFSLLKDDFLVSLNPRY